MPVTSGNRQHVIVDALWSGTERMSNTALSSFLITKQQRWDVWWTLSRRCATTLQEYGPDG